MAQTHRQPGARPPGGRPIHRPVRFTHDSLMDKSFLNSIDSVVLTVGDAHMSGRQVAKKLGIANLQAARRLSKVCAALQVESVRALYALGAIPLVRTKGVGNATMWVAMHLLDAHGYSVERWWGWTDGGRTPKFSSYRHKLMAQAKVRGTHEG